MVEISGDNASLEEDGPRAAGPKTTSPAVISEVVNRQVQLAAKQALAGWNFDTTLTKQALTGWNFDTLAKSAEWFTDLAELVEKQRRRLLPPNLHNLNVTVADLSRLANEGITLWAVPNPQTTEQFLAAPTYGARREILGKRGRAIIDDCQMSAAYAAGGPYAASARELESAIAAAWAGFVGPALSHIASILDTLMHDALEYSSRVHLVRHKPSKNQSVMDHFDELDLQTAMVFRPIWFAYRPMHTREERARSTSFARHAVAHGITGPRVLSFRNFVQAAMLATALINFLSWWALSE